MYSYEEAIISIREVIENTNPECLDDVFEALEDLALGHFSEFDDGYEDDLEEDIGECGDE